MVFVIQLFLFQATMASDHWKQTHALCALALMQSSSSLDGVQAEHRAIAIGRLRRFVAGVDPFDHIVAKTSNSVLRGANANAVDLAAAAANSKALIHTLQGAHSETDRQIIVTTISGKDPISNWLREWIKAVEDHLPRSIFGTDPYETITRKRKFSALKMAVMLDIFSTLTIYTVSGNLALANTAGPQLFFLSAIVGILEANIADRKSRLGIELETLLDAVEVPDSLSPKTWLAISWETSVPLSDIRQAEQNYLEPGAPFWTDQEGIGPVFPLYWRIYIYFLRLRGQLTPSQAAIVAHHLQHRRLKINLLFETTNPEHPELTLVAQIQAPRPGGGRPKKREVQELSESRDFLPELAPE